MIKRIRSTLNIDITTALIVTHVLNGTTMCYIGVTTVFDNNQFTLYGLGS